MTRNEVRRGESKRKKRNTERNGWSGERVGGGEQRHSTKEKRNEK